MEYNTVVCIDEKTFDTFEDAADFLAKRIHYLADWKCFLRSISFEAFDDRENPYWYVGIRWNEPRGKDNASN